MTNTCLTLKQLFEVVGTGQNVLTTIEGHTHTHRVNEQTEHIHTLLNLSQALKPSMGALDTANYTEHIMFSRDTVDVGCVCV